MKYLRASSNYKIRQLPNFRQAGNLILGRSGRTRDISVIYAIWKKSSVKLSKDQITCAEKSKRKP
jgi:hypothetical protein